jgi:phosphomannomutase
LETPIISGSGIRGIFGRSFTAADALGFAAAFGEISGPGQIIVGRDTRSSGPAVEAAVVAGLCSVGCEPVLVGVAPTPTIQMEVIAAGARGGVAITSSHNPGHWNALKLIGPDGIFLRSGARARLLVAMEAPRSWSGYDTVGSPTISYGSVDRHVENVVSLPLVRCDGRPIRAVLDVVGGTGLLLGPALLDMMGVEYSIINSSMTPRGDFPRVAEPLPQNLRELCAAVLETGSDVGFAYDPDGDRLALVDERGRAPGEEYTVALAVDHVLPHRPSPVVVNMSTSSLASVCAARHGCAFHRSPVGEVNVVEEMERRGSTIGGEGNGGVIDRECHAGRDSAVAAAYVISLLRERSCTLSEWIETLPALVMVKLKFRLSRPFDELSPLLEREFGPPSDLRDGLRFDTPGGWLHIRPSGTEPVVRLIAKDEDPRALDSITAKFVEIAGEPCAE